MKIIISNPNYLYIVSFLTPFLVYTLGWSTLYPNISVELLSFYSFTFFVCLFVGIILQKHRPFTYSKIYADDRNGYIICFIYLMYGVEVLYSKSIPLFAALGGNFDYSEYSFGIPVIHTFLVAFNTFYAIYIYHQYQSCKEKNLLYKFLFLILPFILIVTRSSILNIILGAFTVFILSRNNISGKIIGRSIAGALLVFYLFGFLGNLRSANGDSTFIPRASGVTDEFLDGVIPNEFYWSYLYIASPVASLQNNIDNTKAPEGSYKELIGDELLPSFITRFFVDEREKTFYQINPMLNVGTMYVYPFSYLRWEGVVIYFMYFIFILNIYYLIVLKSFTYRTTAVAIVVNIIVFGNFHNTISYSVQSAQLIFPIIFSILDSSRQKDHKKKSRTISFFP